MSRLPTFSHKKDHLSLQQPQTNLPDQKKSALVQSDTNSSTIYTSSHQNTEDQHHNALPLVMYSEQESSTHYERLSMDTTLDQPLEHHQSHHDNESLLDILKETIVKKDDLIHQLTEDKNVLDQKSSQQSLLITTLNQQSTESFTEKQLLNQKVEDMSQLINTLNQQKINDASTNGYLLIQASLSQNAEIMKLKSKLKLAEASYLQMEQEKHSTKLVNLSIIEKADLRYRLLLSESKENLERELKECSDRLKNDYSCQVTQDKNQLELSMKELKKESQSLTQELIDLRLLNADILTDLNLKVAKLDSLDVQGMSRVDDYSSILTLTQDVASGEDSPYVLTPSKETITEQYNDLSVKLDESKLIVSQLRQENKQLTSKNETLEFDIQNLSNQSSTRSEQLVLKNKGLEIDLENLLLQSQIDIDTLEDTTRSLIHLRDTLDMVEAKLVKSELEKESLGELIRGRCGEETDTDCLQDKIQELQSELKDKNTLIESLAESLLKLEASENITLTTQNNHVQTEILEAEVVLLRQSQCHLQNTHDLTKVELQGVLLQLQDKNALIATLNANMNALEVTTQSVREKLQTSSTLVTDKEKEIQSAKNKIDNILLCHSSEIDSMKLNSHLQIENLESLIKTSELNLLIKSQEFEIQSIDNNALSLTIQELSRANKELDIQTACKTSFEDALLLAIIESTNERLLLEAAIADSYIEKKELETRIVDLNTSISLNHQQSEKSRNQLTEFKLRIKQLLIDFGLDESQSIDAISHIYSDKCSLIIEMEEQQSRKNDEVNSIVSALKDKVDDLMARNSNDTKLLSQREQDIEALRSELLLIQNEFDNMVNKENKDINLIQHYETLLKESHSTIDQNLSKIKELKFVTMNQSVELKEHHILMRGLKDEFESCEAGLDSECLKLIDTIKSLELQAVESDALLESLNLNISDLHHVIETQSLELKAKNSLICCMRDEFESCEAGLDSECMKLMDKIEILEEQVVSHKELAVEKCELNTKLVNLMGELRESNHTIERQSKDIDQLKYNIQEIDNDQNKKELTESRDALVHENSLALIQLESLQKHLTDKVNDLHLKTGQLNNIEIKYAQSRKTISNFESALLTAQKMLEDEQSATGQEINKSNSLQLQIDSLSLSQSDHILTIKRLEASIDSQMSEMEIIKQIQIESKRLEKEKSSQLFDLIQANDISKALNTKLVEQNDESIVVIAKIQSSLDESLMYNESIKVKTTHELDKIKNEYEMKESGILLELKTMKESHDTLNSLYSDLIKNLGVAIKDNESLQLQIVNNQGSFLSFENQIESLNSDVKNMQASIQLLSIQIAQNDNVIAAFHERDEEFKVRAAEFKVTAAESKERDEELKVRNEELKVRNEESKLRNEEFKVRDEEFRVILAKSNDLESELRVNRQLANETKTLLTRSLVDIELLKEESIQTVLKREIELKILRGDSLIQKKNLEERMSLLLNEKLLLERMKSEDQERVALLTESYAFKVKELNSTLQKQTLVSNELILDLNKDLQESKLLLETNSKAESGIANEEEMSRLESIANDATDQLDQLNIKYHAKLQELKAMKAKHTKIEKAHLKMMTECHCETRPLSVKRQTSGSMVDSERPSKRQSPQIQDRTRVAKTKRDVDDDKENA